MGAHNTGILCHRIPGHTAGEKQGLSFYTGHAFPVRIFDMLLGVHVLCAFLCFQDRVGQTSFYSEETQLNLYPTPLTLIM